MHQSTVCGFKREQGTGAKPSVTILAQASLFELLALRGLQQIPVRCRGNPAGAVATSATMASGQPLPWPPDLGRCLFITGLPAAANDDTITAIFKVYGAVTYCKVFLLTAVA